MMLKKIQLPLDDCLTLIQSQKHGHRNRCLYYLRTCLRIKDIAGLRTIDQVLYDGQVKGTIIDADGREVVLSARCRTEIYLYLIKRFGSDLCVVAPKTGLFPSEKNPFGATMKTLPQMYWAMDKKLHDCAEYINRRSKPYNVNVDTQSYQSIETEVCEK
jgi:hypothetical protein